jgi:hypothetical protein
VIAPAAPGSKVDAVKTSQVTAEQLIIKYGKELSGMVDSKDKDRDIDVDMSPGRYQVFLYLMPSHLVYQFPKTLETHERAKRAEIWLISALITPLHYANKARKIMHFQPPHVIQSKVFKPRGGWLDELMPLLDNAASIISVDTDWTLAVLRHYLPHEIRMTKWRLAFKLRDVFAEAKVSLKRYYSIRISDFFLEQNEMKHFVMPPATSILQQYQHPEHSAEPLRLYSLLQLYVIESMHWNSIRQPLAANLVSLQKKGPKAGTYEIKWATFPWTNNAKYGDYEAARGEDEQHKKILAEIDAFYSCKESPQ